MIQNHMTYRQIIELAKKRGTYVAAKFADAAQKAVVKYGDSLDDLAL